MAANAENVTDEEIASIAERMSNEGRPVSPVTVWSDLRRGSIVEIAAALQRWRDARQPEAPTVAVNAALPQELGESVLSVAQRLWVVAREETDKLHSQRASVINQRLSAALGDRDEALSEFERVEAQASADRRQMADLQGELRVAADTAARLREELATANDRAERSQTLVGEMMQHASDEEDKLKAATASLEDERRAHEALRAELASRDDAAARIKEEHEQARAEIARLTQELSAAKSRAEAASAEAEQTGARIAQLQSELEEARHTLDTERSAAAARVSESLAQHDDLERVTRELEQARAQLERSSDEKAAANDELAWLKQDASAARGEASTARERATQLENRIAELGRNDSATQSELTRLAQELAAARDRSAELEQQVTERGQTHAASQAEQSRLSQELSAARERLAEVEAQLNERAQSADASQAEHVRLAQELSASRERLAEVEAQLHERAQNADASQAEHARLSHELAESRERAAQFEQQQAEVARVSGALSAARERSEQLEQQLAQRGEGDAATQAEIARVSEEAKAARDEAARLQQQLAQRDHDDAAAKEAKRVQDQALQSRVAAGEQEIVNLQRQIANQAKTHAKSYDELRANAEQWVTYAKDLKQRLDIANEKMVFIDARSTGEVALLRRLSSELERLKPDHELVFREAQQKLIGEKMSQQLAQKGYRYDPATAVMSKIDG